MEDVNLSDTRLLATLKCGGYVFSFPVVIVIINPILSVYTSSFFNLLSSINIYIHISIRGTTSIDICILYLYVVLRV